MCRGKVKNGPGLRNELPVERENAGLRNELEPFWAWKCGAPERAWTVLSVKMRGSGTSLIRFERENANLRNCQDASALPNVRFINCVRAEQAVGAWEAINGLKLKKFWKWWSPERQNPPCKMVMLRNGFWVICENYMLRNGNSGLQMGVSRAAHTQYAYIMEVPPPPPGLDCTQISQHFAYHENVFPAYFYT